MLQPTVFADHEAMSRHAADLLFRRLQEWPRALFCLATGATPLRAYELLAEKHASEPLFFDRMQVIKLDEWGGLAMDDPASCEQSLQRTLIEPLGLQESYIALDGSAPDPEQECRRVARLLERYGPIDSCVLGLGLNGHVGFNEPAPGLQAHAHVAQLSETSLQHAMLKDARSRPSCGLTLGMADILQAELILLLVSGESKQEPLARLLSGPISTDFPASLLALHQNVVLLCDAAASEEAQIPDDREYADERSDGWPLAGGAS